jgi:hypothetical protein
MLLLLAQLLGSWHVIAPQVALPAFVAKHAGRRSDHWRRNQAVRRQRMRSV